MSIYVHDSHNVSVLLYHLVFPAKYRRAVLDSRVDVQVRDTCLEIEKRYELKFLEIGSDSDHAVSSSVMPSCSLISSAP